MKLEPLLIPALRCRMGRWAYYVTALPFHEIAQRVRPTAEIHKSKQLSGWIQRQLNVEHANRITKYLQDTPERFFNAIVVGVYGGAPRWAEIKIDAAPQIDPEQFRTRQAIDFSRSVGVLSLNGRERLFAIDGQHRVTGIRQAVRVDPELKTEEICTIFVGHSNSEEGIKRTRRLFTTLNKTARKVTPADIVALDEDDGFAVTARQLSDEYGPFRDTGLVAFKGTSGLPAAQQSAITSIVGLYELAQDLHTHLFPTATKPAFIKRSRPGETELTKAFDNFLGYWDLLATKVPEYQETVISKSSRPGKYRQQGSNHLLFRPVGQRAFAGAVNTLLSRGKSLKNATKMLLSVDPWLESELWREILWNGTTGRIISKNRGVAQALLLTEIGEPAQSKGAADLLDEIRANRP